MDITPAIVQAVGKSRPKPDLPPGAKRPPARIAALPKPKGQPGYKTTFVNGKWVLVPVNGGAKDPALQPHVYVTPLEK